MPRPDKLTSRTLIILPIFADADVQLLCYPACLYCLMMFQAMNQASRCPAAEVDFKLHIYIYLFTTIEETR